MAGISSKAAGIQENKKQKFQEQEFAHQEFSDGSGLEIYEFKYRNHDPQTGRFWQIDPLSEKYVYNSTYAFSENKVVGHREIEGLEAQVAYYSSMITKEGTELFEYDLRSVHPDDRNSEYGSKGLLTKYTLSDLRTGNWAQFEIYQPVEIYQSENEGESFWDSWFPQMMIYGNGDGSSNIGSKYDPKRKITSINLGKDGSEDEMFNFLLLFGLAERNMLDKDPIDFITSGMPDYINRVIGASSTDENGKIKRPATEFYRIDKHGDRHRISPTQRKPNMRGSSPHPNVVPDTAFYFDKKDIIDTPRRDGRYPDPLKKLKNQ